MSWWSSAFRDFKMQGQARGRRGCKAAEKNTQFSTADRCLLSDLNLKWLHPSLIWRGLMHFIVRVLPFLPFFVCVCVHISVVLSHPCCSLHLTSVYAADFLGHFYKAARREMSWLHVQLRKLPQQCFSSLSAAALGEHDVLSPPVHSKQGRYGLHHSSTS